MIQERDDGIQTKVLPYERRKMVVGLEDSLWGMMVRICRLCPANCWNKVRDECGPWQHTVDLRDERLCIVSKQLDGVYISTGFSS